MRHEGELVSLSLNNETILIVGAALVGAFVGVLLSVLGVTGPAFAGGAGFAVVLWIVAFDTVRHKRRNVENSCR